MAIVNVDGYDVDGRLRNIASIVVNFIRNSCWMTGGDDVAWKRLWMWRSWSYEVLVMVMGVSEGRGVMLRAHLPALYGGVA